MLIIALKNMFDQIVSFYKWLKKLLGEKNSKKMSFGCKIALIFTILRLEKMYFAENLKL